MKKALFVLAIASLLTPAFAGGDVPTVTIVKTDFAKKFSLIVENAGQHASVSLKDKNGVILVAEAISSNYGKIFNLENLPGGQYTIVVETATRDIVQPITLTGEGIVLNENQRYTYFHPIIRTKGAQMDVSLLNNRITDVLIQIQDRTGNIVFEDNLENVLKVERRYNLEQLTKGAYLVKVKTPFKAYFQKLELN